MTPDEALERLLRSYTQYYDVVREGVEPPFAAEALFHSHDEQYFLVKSARLSEADSHEYVFFAVEEALDEARLRLLDEAAWSRGMERVRPHKDHRNSDVTLIVLAERMTPGAEAALKKLKRSKSYRFGLQGWSNYRVIALEVPSGRMAHNRMGRSLRKLLRNITNQK